MDVLGKRLVAALIHEGEPSKLTISGITGPSISGDARAAFEWSESFHKTHGKWPTPKQVEENTKVELPEPPDDLGYICDLIRKRQLGLGLENDFRQAMRSLEKRDPDDALRIAKEMVKRHEAGMQNAQVMSFRQSGPERYGDYQFMQANPGMLGIPTPWKGLNDSIQGWVDGQLHVLLAMTNVGKTWGCLLFANHALKLRHRVLFVTMEMSARRILRRLDALHYKIPFGDLRDVEIDLFSEIRWRDSMITATVGPGDIIVADKQVVKYVSDVDALVAQYKPDLVIIDGGYRFSSKQSHGDWESSKQIVGELQTSAEASNLPWIVSTQQGEVGGSKTQMDAKERAYKVKYAKEWVINPDVAIEMYCNDDLRLLNQMEWRVLRERESKGKDYGEKVVTTWDLEEMQFDQIETAETLSHSGTGSASTSVSY